MSLKMIAMDLDGTLLDEEKILLRKMRLQSRMQWLPDTM